MCSRSWRKSSATVYGSVGVFTFSVSKIQKILDENNPCLCAYRSLCSVPDRHVGWFNCCDPSFKIVIEVTRNPPNSSAVSGILQRASRIRLGRNHFLDFRINSWFSNSHNYRRMGDFLFRHLPPTLSILGGLLGRNCCRLVHSCIITLEVRSVLPQFPALI